MTELIVVTQTNQWCRLKTLVLASVSSPITRRVYNLGLDEFFAWYGQEPRPGFTKATVAAWRVALEARAGWVPFPSTCASPQSGTWRSKPRITACCARTGQRDHAREGCAPRELAHRQASPDAAERAGRRHAQGAPRPGYPGRVSGLRTAAVGACRLTMGHIQQRDGRRCIVDLVGKHGRVRTVPMPTWLKLAIDAWIFRAVNRGGQVEAATLSEKVVWQLLRGYAASAGVPGIAPHDLRRTCAKLCRAAGGELEQIQLLLCHASVQTAERYLGTKQDLVHAPNDGIKLRVVV
jgi:integrase